MDPILCQLTRALVKINQPLKWDIFTVQGKLLLHKGYVVQSEAQLEALLDRGMYAIASEVKRPDRETSQANEFDTFTLWEKLSKISARLNTAYLNTPSAELLTSLDEALVIIDALLDKTPDAAIFEMFQMDMSNYVVAHNHQTTFLVMMIAKRMGWDTKKIRTLARAAATMNIAVLELQSILAIQKEPMRHAQREQMRNHGPRAREILAQMGVTNQDWLRAVAEHHPDILPIGQPPSEMANIIHHADVYLAKISPRATRSAKLPNIAAKEMMQGKTFSAEIVATIIKEIGIYPPGIHVKLANGDTGIVTVRGKQAHTPTVFSLSNGAGLPMMEPVRRDTSTAAFAITSIVPKNKVMVTLNRSKLFGVKGVIEFG